MQNSLSEAIRSQPHSVHGLMMIDGNVDHLQICIESCCNVLSVVKDPGRALIVMDKALENPSTSNQSPIELPLEIVFWNSKEDSVSLARIISDIKRNHQWALLFLGSMNKPWIESAGRLCDHVYLSIPSDSPASFRNVKSKLTKLQKAGIHFAGSYVTAKAA